MLSSLKTRYLSVGWIRAATTAALPLLKNWPLCALLASAALLAIAHAFQTFGGMLPCHLCLKAREVYWTAIGVAAFGVLLQRLKWAVRTRITVLVLLTIIFLFGAALGAYHAGVEWHWWPGPTTCTGGGGGVSADDMAAMLGGTKIEAPACDKAAWVFLGLSMAGWNCLISLGLAKLSALAAARAIARPETAS